MPFEAARWKKDNSFTFLGESRLSGKSLFQQAIWNSPNANSVCLPTFRSRMGTPAESHCHSAANVLLLQTQFQFGGGRNK